MWKHQLHKPTIFPKLRIAIFLHLLDFNLFTVISSLLQIGTRGITNNIINILFSTGNKSFRKILGLCDGVLTGSAK